MRNIEFYIDKAIEKSGAKSGNQLSKMLGLAPNAITKYRNNGILPADETMIKLAKIAGQDEGQALFDLAMWRTTGPAQIAWKKLAEKVIHAIFVFGISSVIFSTNPANANIIETNKHKHLSPYILSHFQIVALAI